MNSNKRITSKTAKGLFLSVLIVFFIYACKKDTETKPVVPVINTTNTTTTASDNIYYQDLSPNVVLNPVISFSVDVLGCPDAPFPSDSTTSYSLDVDSNHVKDIAFSVQVSYKWVSNSSPCANYGYQSGVSSINSNDSFAVYPASTQPQTFPLGLKPFSYGDTIKAGLTFYSFASIYLASAQAPISYNDFFVANDTSTYLAIKHTINNTTMYGWVHVSQATTQGVANGGIIIKEFALNRTNKNQIICGQTH